MKLHGDLPIFLSVSCLRSKPFIKIHRGRKELKKDDSFLIAK